jgi:hypothetical protein
MTHPPPNAPDYTALHQTFDRGTADHAKDVLDTPKHFQNASRSPISIAGALTTMAIAAGLVLAAYLHAPLSASDTTQKGRSEPPVTFPSSAIANPFSPGSSIDATNEAAPRDPAKHTNALRPPIVVEDLDSRELLTSFQSLIEKSNSDSELAYSLSKRLNWCSPRQAALEASMFFDDAFNNQLTASQSAQERHRMCSGLTTLHLTHTSNLLSIAAFAGNQNAQLDLAQESIDRLEKSRKIESETSAEFNITSQPLPSPEHEKQLIENVRVIAKKGNERALSMMAQLSLGRSTLEYNRKDFLTYMLVLQKIRDPQDRALADQLLQDEPAESAEAIKLRVKEFLEK